MKYGRSTTNVTANNTPMVNGYMTIDMIDKGIDLLSKLTESLGTLARTIEAIANVIAMFKKRDSN